MPEFATGDIVQIRTSLTDKQMDKLGVPNSIKPGMYGKVVFIVNVTSTDTHIQLRFEHIRSLWWFPEKYLVIKDKLKIDENLKLGED